MEREEDGDEAPCKSVEDSTCSEEEEEEEEDEEDDRIGVVRVE